MASAPVTASVAFYGLAIAATIRVLRVPGGPAQLETRDREEAAYVQHAREEGILLRLAPGAVFGAQFTGVADGPRRFREQMGEWPAYEPAGCNNILGLSVHLRPALRRLYGA